MRLYCRKPFCGYIFEPQKHFDMFMENFYSPAQSIPHKDLSWDGLKIIARQVFSASLRTLLKFRTNQLSLANIAQITCDLSDAKFHSLFSGTVHWYTNSAPLEATISFKQNGNLNPSFRFDRVFKYFYCFHGPLFL